MKLAPTNQPRHLIARLILLKANDTFLFVPLGVDAVLFRRGEVIHPPRGVAHAIAGSFACTRTAHATGALGGQAGGRLLGE